VHALLIAAVAGALAGTASLLAFIALGRVVSRSVARRLGLAVVLVTNLIVGTVIAGIVYLAGFRADSAQPSLMLAACSLYLVLGVGGGLTAGRVHARRSQFTSFRKHGR